MVKILWVDDEIDLLKPYVLFLETKGYSFSLAIDGNDLIALGFKGKKIGETLEKCLNTVIDGKVENEKDKLIKFIQK